MRRNYSLYFSIWCLLCVILAPIIVVTDLFYPRFYNTTLVEIICGGIFVTAYVLFPLFFIYQIITHIRINFMYQNTMRKRIKKRTTEFTISIILLWCCLSVFYSIQDFIGWWIERLQTLIGTHKGLTKTENNENKTYYLQRIELKFKQSSLHDASFL